ncbi:MAG: MFS transporter [Bryobacteraceae bacterium]|nr:MFS transporter [Bryobacteraceae bacterium]
MTHNRKREQRSWYIYDWANSAFASTVLTLFLGPYLTSIAKAAAEVDGRIYPLGIPVDPRSWWGYLVSASVVLQVFCLPLVGAIADRSTNKKGLLGLLAGIGAGATMALFFIEGTAWQWGGLLFLIANVAFGASIVVYNSFLPEIAEPEERDAVSSRGWGIGYLGGGLVLALNLLLFTKAKDFGITEGMAVRISLCSAGVWWAIFTVVSLAGLRNRPFASQDRAPSAPLQFIHTLVGMRHYPQTLTFLLAYLLYNDAVQAVIAMAAQFGNDELKIPMSTMTGVILMVQFVAFFGAFVFELISRKTGTKAAIIISLFIWTGAVLSMYLVVRDTTGFVIAAAVVALVLGGTQALSRGLFSQMIPKGREAEYFGVYEISDKGTSWMAPLVFALTLQFSGNYRVAILSLLVFFILGMAVLWRVDPGRAAAEAQNPLH